jgi:hypothetical protein
MASRQARARWAVRVSIARRGGWRSWAAVSGDFERELAAQASGTLITPHVDAESRRGSDYVSVTLAMTVAATDVAEALSHAWQAFRLAAANDRRGWDMTSASADVRPQGDAGAPRVRPAKQRGR